MNRTTRTSPTIRLLARQELPVAAGICARAMRDNPIHVVVFGADAQRREQRLTRFFKGLLPYVYRNGSLYGAFAGEQLTAVFGVLRPGHCQPALFEALGLLPTLLRSNSPVGWLRSLWWLGSWARIEPKTPHWHLGPLAVDPHWQRQGIGSRLLSFVCDHGDARPFYLETDKQANVRLYERFGFAIEKTPTILGISGWTMLKQGH